MQTTDINPTILDALKSALGVRSLPLRGVNYILVGRDLEYSLFEVALQNQLKRDQRCLNND